MNYFWPFLPLICWHSRKIDFYQGEFKGAYTKQIHCWYKNVLLCEQEQTTLYLHGKKCSILSFSASFGHRPWVFFEHSLIKGYYRDDFEGESHQADLLHMWNSTLSLEEQTTLYLSLKKCLRLAFLVHFSYFEHKKFLKMASEPAGIEAT